MGKTAAQPMPKVVTEVCSLCGLDWNRHGTNPTSEKCISLLLDEVRSLNARLAVRPAIPYTYPLPYPVPYTPLRPWWQQTWVNTYTYASNVTARTPQITSGGIQ